MLGFRVLKNVTLLIISGSRFQKRFCTTTLVDNQFSNKYLERGSVIYTVSFSFLLSLFPYNNNIRLWD